MSTGRIVTVSVLDSVRVVSDDTRTTVPAAWTVAADGVLTHAFNITGGLRVEPFETTLWKASIGADGGIGDTPWGAVIALAGVLAAKEK